MHLKRLAYRTRRRQARSAVIATNLSFQRSPRLSNSRAKEEGETKVEDNKFVSFSCLRFCLSLLVFSLRCSRPTHSTKPFVYTEGLERLRRRQLVSRSHEQAIFGAP